MNFLLIFFSNYFEKNIFSLKMFSNPLFESKDNSELNDSYDTNQENFSFKPQNNEALIDQARTSINNLMLKFEKPKKNTEKIKENDEDDDNFKLLSESFLINLDKLNTSNITMKPLDLELPSPDANLIKTSMKNSSLNIQSKQNHQIISENKSQNTHEVNKNQFFESQIATLQETIEKLSEDQGNLLREVSQWQSKASELERENLILKQKQAESQITLHSLSSQLQRTQDQTSISTQDFLSKKESLTRQYEKQIEELKEIIRNNEDLLRKSVNKETLYNALQVQMDELRNSNETLQKEMSGLLNVLENAKASFLEKEQNFAMNFENLQRELQEYKSKEWEYKQEIQKLQSLSSSLKSQQDYYKTLVEEKEQVLLGFRGKEQEKESLLGDYSRKTQELQEKYADLETNLVHYQAEVQTLEAVNKQLKRTIEELESSLRFMRSELQEKDTSFLEKEVISKEKYSHLEELYHSSKEIIDTYSKELEDYKAEKGLLLKQLLEERSRNQQERLSFTDQRKIYEENLKKFEFGALKKEEKIKELMHDLLEKESFIRMSISGKNEEFQRLQSEYFKVLSEKDLVISGLREEIKGLKLENEKFSQENHLIKGELEKIKSFSGNLEEKMQRKEKDHEMRVRKLVEDSENRMKELKNMQQHKTLLLESKIQQLQIGSTLQTPSITPSLNPFLQTKNVSQEIIEKNTVIPYNNSINVKTSSDSQQKYVKIEEFQRKNVGFEEKSSIKSNIFMRKENIREEEIFHEVSNLKKEVFTALQSYQKMLDSIKSKRVSSINIKKYIGDYLYNIFIQYTKILFVYFKPNESFVNILNLSLYTAKPELIKRKVLTKRQYQGFKDIFLRTSGAKEQEINEIMRNCNDFILEFYEFMRKKPQNAAFSRGSPKKSIENIAKIELFCGFCGNVLPAEIYKSHSLTCQIYNKGGSIIFEEDIPTKKIMYIRNKRTIILNLVEKIIFRINYLTNHDLKQRLISLLSSIKTGGNEEFLLKELIFIGKEVESSELLIFLIKLIGVMKATQSADFDGKTEIMAIDNIVSD